MNCPVALQSTRAGPELTSAMSVVWISTLMTRDFGVGVAAITYLFGSHFSHRLSCTQGSFRSCSGFSVTVSGCSVREGGMGIISFSGSKTENLLYTGSVLDPRSLPTNLHTSTLSHPPPCQSTHSAHLHNTLQQTRCLCTPHVISAHTALHPIINNM